MSKYQKRWKVLSSQLAPELKRVPIAQEFAQESSRRQVTPGVWVELNQAGLFFSAADTEATFHPWWHTQTRENHGFENDGRHAPIVRKGVSMRGYLMEA